MPGADADDSRAGQAPDGASSLRIEDVALAQGPAAGAVRRRRAVEAAEALRGRACGLRRRRGRRSSRALFYETDLVGCRVETEAGDAGAARSARVEGAPGASVLVVEAARSGEVLVPLADGICRVIDPAARRIVIDPPAGLLDLNAPRRAAAASAGRVDRRSSGQPR